MASERSFFETSNELRSLQTQVREKELVIEDLQKNLDEQLSYLQMSHDLEKQKVHQEKSFVRFLYELNFATDIDDLFRILRAELKRFHGISEPLFGLQFHAEHSKLYFFSSQKLNCKSFHGFNQSLYQGTLPSEITQELATLYGRPFGQLTFFRSRLKLIRKFLPEFEFYVFFENQMVKTENSNISTEIIQSRIEVLNLMLDRKLLEEQSHLFVARWEKTFDRFKDPICLKDIQGKTLRSNLAYQKLMDQKMPSDVLARRFNKKIHPLRDPATQKQMGSVELYIDQEEFETFRKLEILNEKMTALGQLAGNIAHELNNPLSGILSMCQILIEELKTAPVSENLGQFDLEVQRKIDLEDQLKMDLQIQSDLVEIEKATRRCQKIIQDLTQFSFQGEIQDQDHHTMIDDSIRVVLSLLKTSLRSHHVHLQLNAGNYWIDIPHQLFQQIMFNLIHNACQSMKETGDLIISTAIKEKNGLEQCMIVVDDSGTGISAEIAKHIFEPFFTTKEEGQGTGLGLHLSKTIVEKYQGTIRFENKTKSTTGIRFIVEFPAKGI